MRRNSNLELRLVPVSDPSNIHQYYQEMKLQRQTSLENPEASLQQQQQQQQLTIFYNGKVCVSDVTEAQARSILMMASREIMEEKMRTPSGSSSEPATPGLASPACAAGTGLSMKRSLERFLQKRKNRIQATTPIYPSHPQH